GFSKCALGNRSVAVPREYRCARMVTARVRSTLQPRAFVARCVAGWCTMKFRPRVGLLGVSIAVGLVAAPVCRADLLTFQFDPNGPFLQGIAGTLDYNAVTHRFHSETSPIAYTIASRPNPGIFSSGTTTIDLFVNASGGFAGSGTGLKVTG